MTTFEISFLPGRRRFAADRPVDLAVAAAACDILLDQPCGSRLTCGKCRVRVLEGAPGPTLEERRLFGARDLEDGWRLGCQLVLEGPATVEIPPLARTRASKWFGDGSLIPDDAVPVVVARTIDPSSGGAPEPQADLDRIGGRLAMATRSLRVPVTQLAELQRRIREGGGFQVVLKGRDVIAFRSASARGPYGVALDIGTTTVAAAIVELPSAGVVASGSTLNAQVALGADVMSRIRYATEHREGNERLTSLLRGCVNELFAGLCADAGCSPEELVALSCAGNPTMMHSFVGADVSPLGRAPYAGAWTQALSCRAGDLGLAMAPGADVYLMPAVESHVGADAVAGAVACGLDRADRPTLFIDLGTNTEILIAVEDRCLAASAAAGPAFEGASIHHGMRASDGAIEAVSISSGGDLRVNVVGGAAPVGLCGSGLIDAVAELLRVGIIESSGSIAAAGGIGVSVAPALLQRLAAFGNQRCVVLAGGESGREVVLTARDVRQLQLVKASIGSAVTILCRRAGIEAVALDRVLIAGVFGSYLRTRSMVGVGLVPGVDGEKIQFAGNAAGLGARLALVDRRARERAEVLAARAEHVELAGEAAYSDEFMRQLEFPVVG
jgi:uncharacterized 2Fe-2S/4Fe-4S cluster protein (DUF4445 family)